MNDEQQIRDWLDQADQLLAQPPTAGELMTLVEMRVIEAQILIARAQSATTRRILDRSRSSLTGLLRDQPAE